MESDEPNFPGAVVDPQAKNLSSQLHSINSSPSPIGEPNTEEAVASSAVFPLASPQRNQEELRGGGRAQGNRRTFGNFQPYVHVDFTTYEVESSAVRNTANPVDIAKNYFASLTRKSIDNLRVTNAYKTDHNGLTHVYLVQLINGIEVSNAVANLNVDRNGQIISLGNSFYSGPEPSQSPTPPAYSAPQAVHSLAALLHIEHTGDLLEHVGVAPNSFTISGASFANNDITAQLKYLQIDNGTRLALTWDLVVPMEANHYNAFTDVDTGNVLALNDWVVDAASANPDPDTYNVYGFGTNDPEDGPRSTLTNPANPMASPQGWLANRPGQWTTVGNNVAAQDNRYNRSYGNYINNHRPVVRTPDFNFPVNFKKSPINYVDASITNLFYWTNTIHDIYYQFGFDEKSGNFQYNNYGKGGKGSDAVIANAQDGDGVNNANFATLPEGQPPRMRMYVFTLTDPARDGDLDNGIVIHEYTHGLSSRLTGGSFAPNCLQTLEAGGMGEGWSDIFPTVFRVTENSTRSQDLDIGEVWAEMLYEVFWNMVDAYGFYPNWFNPKGDPYKGNIMFMQLLIDGMKMQPCYPSFIQARDAILQADQTNYNSANQCSIWKGFAKRGMGLNAQPPYSQAGLTEDYAVPKSCV